MPATEPTVVELLRKHQEADPMLGQFFAALHTFADRLYEHFYSEYPDLPRPVVALEKDRSNRRGYYTEKDGYTFVHRINLNPFTLRNGVEAAETLAHEIVHLWQAHVGRPCVRNYHGAEFHAQMALYGIETHGRLGYHRGYIDSTWADFMATCDDLDLASYVLPGMDAKAPRKMLKLQCPECGNSVRNRREISILCGDCLVPFELVQDAKGKKISR